MIRWTQKPILVVDSEITKNGDLPTGLTEVNVAMFKDNNAKTWGVIAIESVANGRRNSD